MEVAVSEENYTLAAQLRDQTKVGNPALTQHSLVIQVMALSVESAGEQAVVRKGGLQ